MLISKMQKILRKPIAIVIAVVMLMSAVAAFASPAPDPKVVFDNYPVVSTYIENCEVGDIYTLSARVLVGDVYDNDVTWDFAWATATQQIGSFVSVSGNTATIEALSFGNTRITATASKAGTVIASAQAILNVLNSSDYNEYWRTQFHFSPRTNWCNDPNGLVYYDGEWHLSFQYNAFGNSQGNLSWGHAVSTDMVHWEQIEPALYPDNATFGSTAQPGFANLGSIFSGSAVVDVNNTSGFFTDTPEKQGLVAIFTHSGTRQQQSIAYSKDKGRTWTKYEGNPVISAASLWASNGSRAGDPGDPLNNTAFRDPKVIWLEEAQLWIMAVAGGPARFYSSPDLKNWSAEAMQPEIVTECPDLFKLEVDDSGITKWVFLEGGRYYRIGEFKILEDGAYAGKWGFVTDADPNNLSDPYHPGIANTPGIARYYMNYGGDAYAAQTYSDGPDGRRILIQWMNNWSYANRSLRNFTAPFSGQMTLHEELSLTRVGDGSIRLQQTPVKEYEMLRMNAVEFQDVTITPTNNVMKGLTSGTFEIKASITPEPGTEEVGFKVRVGGGYETVIKYNILTQTVETDKSIAGPRSHLINGVDTVFVDASQNGEWWTFFDGLNIGTATVPIYMPYAMVVPMEDGKIDLHIFVDRCSVETYAGRHTAVGSTLILPHQTESGYGIEAYSIGGNAQADIEFYDMSSAWDSSYYSLNTDTAFISITGSDSVVTGAGATSTYTISAARMPETVNGIELEFEVDGSILSSNNFSALGVFSFLPNIGNYNTPIWWTYNGNIWTGKVTLLNTSGAAIDNTVDLLELVFNVKEGELGSTAVKLNYIKLSSLGSEVASVISKNTAVTELTQYYSPYDLNKDGVIDLNDLTFALQYLTIASSDLEWEQAKICDFSGNGSIGIEDLILILANYTIPYYN